MKLLLSFRAVISCSDSEFTCMSQMHPYDVLRISWTCLYSPSMFIINPVSEIASSMYSDCLVVRICCNSN